MGSNIASAVSINITWETTLVRVRNLLDGGPVLGHLHFRPMRQ